LAAEYGGVIFGGNALDELAESERRGYSLRRFNFIGIVSVFGKRLASVVRDLVIQRKQETYFAYLSYGCQMLRGIEIGIDTAVDLGNKWD
jgi:hypothetical protein